MWKRLLTRLTLVLLTGAFAVAAVGAGSASAAQVQINNAYGRCLDAQLQSINQNVTAVQLWDCLPGAPYNQEWYLDAIAGTSAVRIRSADGGRCLNATGAGNGSSVDLSNCAAGNRYQEWLLGPSHIVNIASGRYLDAKVQDIKDDGTPVQMWQPNNAPQQNWFHSAIPGSLRASPPNLAVGTGQTGTTTISWSAPGVNARVWESVGGAAPALFATGAHGSQVAAIHPGIGIAGTTVFTLTYGTDDTEHLASLTVTASPAAGTPASVAAPCLSGGVNAATALAAIVQPHSRVNPLSDTLGFGRTAAVTGALTGASGAGVAGVGVCLVAQDDVAGAPMQLVGSTVTGQGGTFVLSVHSGPSRTLWAVSDGATSVLSSTLQVNGRTRITVRANRRRLLNGRVFTLRGSVPGPIPAHGVLVLVQVWRGTYWETFEDTHTGRRGGYTARYRFRFTTVPTSYRMRTVVPSQSSYPYLGSSSRSVRIRVRP